MFDDNFFWREVNIPKATGTDRDKKKEEVVMSNGLKGLFNVMCVAEETRQDYTEFEESNSTDDDVLSVVSSVAAVEPSNPMEDN